MGIQNMTNKLTFPIKPILNERLKSFISRFYPPRTREISSRTHVKEAAQTC